MSKARNILTIFLASPGDLQPEREVAQRVVKRLNNAAASELGWYIELLGWEDTRPGYFRPQDKINEDVDKCDLLWGLLWQRWGQSTGIHSSYSSGFEEEFERAVGRRWKTGTPDIWLFFKEIPTDRLGDPGEQLQKVLAFRESLVKSKELLFREFKDEADLERHLYDSSLKYLFEQTRAAGQLLAPETSPPREDTLRVPVETQSEDVDQGRVQITTILEIFKAAVEGKRVPPLEFSEVIDRFSVARLNLFSFSWLSSGYSKEILGAHEINLLYQDRNRLSLLQPERLIVFRTLLGNTETTAPGWFWSKNSKPDYILFLTAALASGDGNDVVRTEAIKILTALRRRPDKRVFDWGDFVQRLLSSGSAPVVNAALDYIAAVGSTGDSELLKHTDPSRAAETRLVLLAKRRPAEAFEALIDVTVPPKKALAIIERNSSVLDEAMLLRGLGSKRSLVRFFAFNELERRGSLTVGQLSGYLADPLIEIRRRSYRLLIEAGQRFGPDEIIDSLKAEPELARISFLGGGQSARQYADELILAQLSTLSFDELNEKIEWLSIDGHSAYRILAEKHFADFNQQLREDLASGFSRLENAWRSDLGTRYGTLAEELSEKVDKITPFIRDQFTIAALSALAVHGDPSDVDLVRPFLSHSNPYLVEAAVAAMRRVGSKDDAKTLMELYRSHNTLSKARIAEVAVALDPSLEGIAGEFLASDDPDLVRAALVAFADAKVPDPKVEQCLYSTHVQVRAQGLWYLATRRGRKYLSGLLSRYLATEFYYYDVVTWLDRLLYAPKALRALFLDNVRRSGMRPEMPFFI